MRDYLHIGSTPPEESCTQLKSGEDNSHLMKAECQAYIMALRRFVGPEPEGAQLAVKREEHDFGSYYEVVCHYDTSFPVSQDYALLCEGYGPSTWAEAGMEVQVINGELNVVLDPTWKKE